MDKDEDAGSLNLEYLRSTKYIDSLYEMKSGFLGFYL